MLFYCSIFGEKNDIKQFKNVTFIKILHYERNIKIAIFGKLYSSGSVAVSI